jgi:two-component system OmpR family sensor kinase
MTSIRRNLLVTLMATMLVTLGLAAAGTYRAAVEQANALLDYELRQFALALRDRALGMPDTSALPGDWADFDYSIQVRGDNGVVLNFSYPAHVLPNAAQLGYSTVQTNEGPWRVYVLQGRSSVVQVAQPLRRRDQLAAHAAWLSLRWLMVMVPVVALLIWAVVGRGLAPISRLARAIGTRTPAVMEPVSEPAPIEVQPLVRALNDLLARLKAALDSQRQFVADAAHELRTPLQALQLQAQLVERASDPSERETALVELKEGLTRAAHLVQQLLTLASEEPGATQRELIATELKSLVDAVVGNYQSIAMVKGVACRVGTIGSVPRVLGDPVSLRTLLSNLVDNAVRYTPGGGEVVVSVASRPGVAIVEVADSGPGIPREERSRVFDRFYRRPGLEPAGTGLGLAIVKAIADRHGLRIVLDTSDLGGLLARVEFPSSLFEPAAAPDCP